MKHTPGPWTATDPHQWLQNTPRFKCSIRYGKTNLGNSIAEVYLGGPGALSCDAESVNANARLIAAAPELLEALEKIRNLERRNFREAWDMLQEVDRLAGAAIRKAKGEQP